jgi:hypothetical protein
LEQDDAVAELAQAAEPQPEPGAGDPLAGLAGKVVGLYTLTPGVAQRVTRMLRARCADIEIETNDDLVSTERLRGLAQRADVMVVAFQSAKHAATDAIIAVRGRERVVRALGKGAGGVIRALETSVVDAPDLGQHAA